MTAMPNAEPEQSTPAASSNSRSGGVKVSLRSASVSSRDPEPRVADLARSPRAAVRDVIAGSISALVTLSYSLSFAAMIFSGPLKGHLEDGVRMSLMSAGLTLILVALTSPFFFAIAGPDSRSAAVQAAMAMMLSEKIADKDPSVHIVFALAVSTAMTGAALYVLGRLKMGRWVRYIPYPVVGGFLVSTGWVLAVGGMRVMVPPEVQVNFDLLSQLIQRGALLQTTFGVVFAVTMFVVLGRAQQYFALPVLLVAGTLFTHLIIALDPNLSLARAQEAGWLLRVSENLSVNLPFVPFATGALEWPALRNFVFEVITLVSVTAIAVLVTAAAIEVATKRDADLDQELRGHGIANIVSGLCGGLVGSNAVARSMLNLQAGATTRLSGVIAGTLCLLVLFVSPKLAGLLSRPVLGATLVYLGLRLLQEWLFKAYWKLHRTDYMLVVLMLLLIIITSIFVVGLFVGALASCLIFAVNYSRVSVVKNSFTLDEYGSKVQRSAEENQVLRVRGRQHLVLRLRGYLFFGSIVGLVADIRTRIRRSYAQETKPLKTVVLDFRYVNGMDSSTALTLVKLRQTIEDRRMQLVFTSLNPEMERALRREHCVRDDDVCLVFDDLDNALEWCEQRAVMYETSLSRVDMPFVQRLAKEFGSVDLAARFMDYVVRIELRKGEYLFRQGDASAATYVVESGRVNIVLERPDGPPLLLRSVTSNTTLGEMGLYRQSIRSASVMADAHSVVHKLERVALDRMETEDPRVAAAFHTFVIRTLADRLHVADKAISALER